MFCEKKSGELSGMVASPGMEDGFDGIGKIGMLNI